MERHLVPSDAPNALATELDRAESAFRESVDALKAFVDTSQRSIEKDAKQLAELRGRFVAAKTGDPPPTEPPTGPDVVAMKFSAEEVDVIVDAMEHFGGVMDRFPTMLMDMALIYLLALFDAFIADVFRAVLVARPEMLRSRRQLTYETILAFEDRDELVAAMATREISDIAYKSLAEQVRYYSERFGVDLEASEDVAVEDLGEMAARRNLLVHNAGVVNDIYLQTVPNATSDIGDRLKVDDAYWGSAWAQTSAAVSAISRALRDKFGPDPLALRAARSPKAAEADSTDMPP